MYEQMHAWANWLYNMGLHRESASVYYVAERIRYGCEAEPCQHKSIPNIEEGFLWMDSREAIDEIQAHLDDCF